MTTNLSLTSEKRFSRLSNIFILRKMEPICQFMVFQINLKIMLPLKKILGKVLKLTQMNNSEWKKKIFMRRNQVPLNNKLQLHHSLHKMEQVVLMRLINGIMNSRLQDLTLFSWKIKRRKKLIWRTFKLKVWLEEEVLVKSSWFRKYKMEKFMLWNHLEKMLS